VPEAYLYFDEAPRAEKEDSSRMERLLKRLVLALAIILSVELVWYFALTPCLPLTTVDLAGAAGLDRDAVLAVAGITEKTSFVTLDVSAAAQALGAIPTVESVRIVKRFPDAVRIALTPRTAAAVALAVIDGRTVPLYLDRQGVVFAVGMENTDSLPIISGLVFEKVSLGMRLPPEFTPFLAALDRIRLSAPELLGAVSEIRVHQRPYDGYELVVYPAHHPVRVKIGAELNEEGLRYMMLVLDVLASRGIEADEIDFRTGTASYRTKEASSG